MSQQERGEILEEFLAKYNSQTRVIALTVLGTALNSLLALPAYQAVFNFLYQQKLDNATSTMLTLFFLLNIIVVLVYCWGASISFHPKRLVNPLHIQLASAGLVTIFIVVANVKIFFPIHDFLYFITGAIGTIIAAIVQFGIFGVLQLFIVRWLVGLTGTIDDLDRKSFLINADFQTLSNILLGDSFLQTWNLEQKKRGENLLEVYTSYSASWQIRLVLGLSKEPNKSILATVAFEKRFYTICYSTAVCDCRDDMIRRIESIIGKNKLSSIDFNNEPSGVALKSALGVTRPKTIVGRSELGEIPAFYRNISILLGVIVAALFGLYYFNIFSIDVFMSSIIVVILTAIVELGPRLKEIIDSKKKII
jgi:hypothetical protein